MTDSLRRKKSLKIKRRLVLKYLALSVILILGFILTLGYGLYSGYKENITYSVYRSFHSSISGVFKGKTVSRKMNRFPWPDGKAAALSLTFDDGRASQVQNGVPFLNKYNINATFYLQPGKIKKYVKEWKEAVSNGHEIGNHTINHPCTGNSESTRRFALEEYDLEKIAGELEGADSALQYLLGVKPVSFAYPCGQKFVGRGKETKSYVPLVAKRFVSGRGYPDEFRNDPSFLDMARLMGINMDNTSFVSIRYHVDEAIRESSWLILVGHEIQQLGAYQTTSAYMLRELIEYANDPSNNVWIAPVKDVAAHINSHRINTR